MLRFIASQFRKPSGIAGVLVARIMDIANGPIYRKMVETLHVTEEDSVLEIGFGSGIAMKTILRTVPRCRVDGIDFSPLMYRRGEKRNRACIRQGRARLMLGDFADSNLEGQSYSKIYAINVVYFWPDLPSAFGKIRHLLKPGGRVGLYVTHEKDMEKLVFTRSSVFNNRPIEDLLGALREAGFESVGFSKGATMFEKGYYVWAEKRPAKAP